MPNESKLSPEVKELVEAAREAVRLYFSDGELSHYIYPEMDKLKTALAKVEDDEESNS